MGRRKEDRRDTKLGGDREPCKGPDEQQCHSHHHIKSIAYQLDLCETSACNAYMENGGTANREKNVIEKEPKQSAVPGKKRWKQRMCNAKQYTGNLLQTAMEDQPPSSAYVHVCSISEVSKWRYANYWKERQFL